MALYPPLVLVLALAQSNLDFVRVPPEVQEVTDPYTGLTLRVRVDGFEIASTETPVSATNLLPMTNVTWVEAARFANEYSVSRGLEPCYDLTSGARRVGCKGYRLPTDAEWSIAYRRFGKAPNTPAPNLGLDTVTGISPSTLTSLKVREIAKVPAGTVSDLAGNVWEWCEDWFSANPTPWPVHNPTGPLRGLARVIRGGSYLTTRSSWQGSLRSSMDPNAKSPRLGFRLVRSTGEVATLPDLNWASFRKPPATLKPGPTAISKVAREKWHQLVGISDQWDQKAPPVRMLRRIEDPWFNGDLMEYETEPGSWEKMLILDSDPGRGNARRPVVIVPFYDVDTPAGLDLGGRNFAMTAPVIWFARQAAQRGYLAVAVRWYGESYGERYDEAVANLGAKHPGLTGLGKWVNDSRKLIDYLVTRPDVDPDRIAMMGHSLGGKMTMYASAFDSRIKAAVVSDPGVPLASTNYSDYWYLGDKVKSLPTGTDHHELVGLMAPRALLVVAGQADDARTWSFLEAARGLWGPDVLDRRLGWIHHATGHRPPAEAMSQAWEWLDANLRDENGWERLGEGTYHLSSDPAVDDDGVVYFTDSRRDRIMKVDLDGKVSVWRQGTHESHGLAYSRKERRLYAGQHDLKRIAAFSLDNNSETAVTQGLTTHHLKASSQGRLYFNEAPAHKVWMLDKPGESTARVVHGGLNWPRGLALFEGGGDRNFLTVSDPGTRWIWRFQVAGDGSLTGGHAFCELRANSSGGLDPGGMAFDEQGFMYVATDVGVQVCDLEGKVTSVIGMPGAEGGTNVAFAGPGLQWLYLTDGARLYRRPMPRRGARVQEQ